MEQTSLDTDYERIATAIALLEARFREQPSLAELAHAAGLSEFHFQRLFRRWAGISPKRFVQFLTAEHARARLEGTRGVLDATFDSGLSGPGRLHDLFVNVYAATPAEVRRAGAGLVVRHGFATTPFGQCLVGTTERGICWLAFVDGEDRAAALEALRGRWSGASFVHEESVARDVVRRVFAAAATSNDGPLTLHLRGTNFQIRVWEALLRIPEGGLTTYEDVASSIGAAGAARAVGGAIGQNPVAFVIPCHRVLRKSGALGGYRWGLVRKRAMLSWEASRADIHADGEG